MSHDTSSPILLASLAALLLAHCARAADFTNSASADAFVRAAAPMLNYGGAGALSVSGPNSVNGSGVTNGIFDSFIRFNSVAMVASFNSAFGANNWVMTSAKLRVTELSAPANTIFNRGIGSFEIRWIANDSWIEGTGTPNSPATTGITYNDEPTLFDGGRDVSLGAFTNAGVDATLSFSLALPAAFVNDLRAGGEIGLFFTPTDPEIGFTFDSRSFGTVSARPFLEISALPRPGISSISVSGTNLLLTGTNGAAGGTYHVLTSTNAAMPLTGWTAIATNVLPGNGDFTLTNTLNAGSSSHHFFVLQAQ